MIAEGRADHSVRYLPFLITCRVISAVLLQTCSILNGGKEVVSLRVQAVPSLHNSERESKSSSEAS